MFAVFEIDYLGWIPIFAVSILAALALFFPATFNSVPEWISAFIINISKAMARIAAKLRGGDITLDEAIEAAGYAYEPQQDLFYSIMDAWQREMGYCRLYDESAAPMGMIIDCEPIYFEYGGKRWLVEFWKGQYDLTTGCEIGIYSTDQPDIGIPGVFKGPFFECAGDDELTHMSYTLKKNGHAMFARNDVHWWLTGFKLGEFSEPSELTMDLSVTLKDEEMRDAFIGGLISAGYQEHEIGVNQNTVSLCFDIPRTEQPITRTPETDRLIQRKNQIMCEQYQEITGPYETFPEKVKAIQEKLPELYEKLFSFGKPEKLFGLYDEVKELEEP